MSVCADRGFESLPLRHRVRRAGPGRSRRPSAGEVPTLGHWFRTAGYDTHYAGKWHITHADLHETDGTRIATNDADGNVLCAMSFGFHTAARAFANSISNLCTDSGSDIKYWHICKVMGRSASHLALEVALQTHANITLIGEDLADYVDDRRITAADAQGTTDYTAYGMTLRHLSRVICDGIVRRAAVGKKYGVIVIPEGILEFVNEIQVFILKLNTIIADHNATHDLGFHKTFPLLEDKLEYLRRTARQSEEGASITVWNRRDDDLSALLLVVTVSGAGDAAPIAAIVETSGGPYYVKFIGPNATVAEYAGSFDALIASIVASP